jgi:hypothetical protein
MRLLACFLALLLAAPALSLPIPQQTQIRPVGQDGCETCKQLIETVEEYLEDPETQAMVAAFVDDQVCALLPKDVADTCVQVGPISPGFDSMNANFECIGS